jgi:hypothetical protein
MTRRPDPHAPLCHALVANARTFHLSLDIAITHERPWSSATFTGCRLTLTLTIGGGDPSSWLASLPEADFALPRRLVADLAVTTATATAATLEVLLLED